MIEQKITKKVKKVTSSYFNDARLVKQSLYDSKADDYVSPKWRKDKPRDFTDIQFATDILYITLMKKGARELSSYISSLPEQALENTVTDYKGWRDYDFE